MKYDDVLCDCMMRYPSLFVTEWDVLDHLFFVSGNGYEWKYGGLMPCWDPGTYEDHRHQQATQADYFADRLGDFCTGALLARQQSLRLEASLWRAEPFSLEPLQALAVEENVTYAHGRTQIYPLSQYSQLCCLPADIQPDWLAAAQAALRLAGSGFYELRDSDREFLAGAALQVQRIAKNRDPLARARWDD